MPDALIKFSWTVLARKYAISGWLCVPTTDNATTWPTRADAEA